MPGDGVNAEATGCLVDENKDETPVSSVEWKEQLKRLKDELKEAEKNDER